MKSLRLAHAFRMHAAVVCAAWMLSCTDSEGSRSKPDAGDSRTSRPADAGPMKDAGREADATIMCTAQTPCCDLDGDMLYIDCETDYCPAGYSYAQCSDEQRCADSSEP